MRNLMYCRRTFVTVLSITYLFIITLTKNIDATMAISTACAALCAANSWEKRGGTTYKST